MVLMRRTDMNDDNLIVKPKRPKLDYAIRR